MFSFALRPLALVVLATTLLWALVLGWWQATEYEPDAGFVVLLTPKSGRPGYVQASEIEESASTAGLVTGSPVNVSKEWAATRLMPPKGSRR